MNGEGVDRHRQVFGVHLRETLAARVVSAAKHRRSEIDHSKPTSLALPGEDGELGLY